MHEVILKRFEKPDEVRTMPRGRFEVVNLGGQTIGRASYETLLLPTTLVLADATQRQIASLRRVNDDVREVAAGFECGIVLHNYADIKEGDQLEVYETRQVERTLS